ncbi:MAG: hypothetical protein WB762_31275, partial [Candidatus Sulfotelmatobacter sp.]
YQLMVAPRSEIMRKTGVRLPFLIAFRKLTLNYGLLATIHTEKPQWSLQNRPYEMARDVNLFYPAFS